MEECLKTVKRRILEKTSRVVVGLSIFRIFLSVRFRMVPTTKVSLRLCYLILGLPWPS